MQFCFFANVDWSNERLISAPGFSGSEQDSSIKKVISLVCILIDD